ncbi:pyruvate, phosphate dikinase, partial [Candidatus Bipolaricaulota bacterium]|nr:pyruvate, phosphate dikinase [Candidatus Bipolaricaulota bacterium]
MKELLGGKGANLAEMSELGIPVPPGFTITTEVCGYYADHDDTYPESLRDEVAENLKKLEAATGKAFGGIENPLLVSVRSGAFVSMPGMMDTILNIEDGDQVLAAIKHIFESWDNMRAVEYRRLNNISPTLGTAAIVQAMVYGNLDDKSGTGVVFSRNPSTGETGLFGEYLISAQGEDLVSGVRTPKPVATLESEMPEAYKELDKIAQKLEEHFRDMQDIEFTIENHKLWLLQTRSGKRTITADIKIALDMVAEGLIDKREAILRVEPEKLDKLLHPTLDPDAAKELLAKGLPASPG